MGLNNFQITLKGKQPSPRIYLEDVTQKQESSGFCFRSWGMLIPKAAIMMWFKYLFPQVRCPFCQPKEIWHLVATIKLEITFLFGLYKSMVTDDSELYYDLCYGSLQVALTRIFYLVFLGFGHMWLFLRFCPVCKGQFCSWWLLQPAKAGGWGTQVCRAGGDIPCGV